jgi:hypothetical protein
MAVNCNSLGTSSTSRPETAAPAATRPTTPRTPTACSARSSASTRWPAAAYGFRNPWRFSFDDGPGGPYILIGDVGQDRFEEVDYDTVAAANGANFGWDALEGFGPYSGQNSGTPDPGGTTQPILVYGTHDDGNCAIIGGFVVRDRSLGKLRGRYLYSDFCNGRVRSLVPHLGHAGHDRAVGIRVPDLSAFGEGSGHRVYVCSLDGPVYRLVRTH